MKTFLYIVAIAIVFQGPVCFGQSSLGIYGVTPHGETGVKVTRVTSGGPAEKAGILVGDIITRVGTKQPPQIDEESELLSAKPAGSHIQVTFLREGVGHNAVVTLAMSEDGRTKEAPKAIETLPEKTAQLTHERVLSESYAKAAL